MDEPKKIIRPTPRKAISFDAAEPRPPVNSPDPFVMIEHLGAKLTETEVKPEPMGPPPTILRKPSNKPS